MSVIKLRNRKLFSNVWEGILTQEKRLNRIHLSYQLNFLSLGNTWDNAMKARWLMKILLYSNANTEVMASFWRRGILKAEGLCSSSGECRELRPGSRWQWLFQIKCSYMYDAGGCSSPELSCYHLSSLPSLSSGDNGRYPCRSVTASSPCHHMHQQLLQLSPTNCEKYQPCDSVLLCNEQR